MGWFSTKTAAPATQTPPPPAPIAVTGMGVACHAGDQPYALLSSIQAQISGAQLSDEFQIKQSDGTNAVPRMAPVEELGGSNAIERAYQLTTIALSNATEQLAANVNPEELLVVFTIAPEFIMNLMKIDPQNLQGHLIESIPRLANATFRILPNDANSSTSALRTSIAELNEGKWQTIIFGGADSLISMDACLKLHDDNRLNIVGKKGGLIPGEAAAFVVLQSQDAAASNTTSPIGHLRGLGVAAEPHARIADREATTGLTTAINQALTQAGMDATDIQGIVHNLGAETVQAFEWYKTTQKVWPRKISEQQRMAVQLGEIDQPDIPDDPIPRIEQPCMTMGEVGAAAMPIQLATALAWLEYSAGQARFGFPLRSHLLVCDTPDAPERGALIISATAS